MKLYARLFLIAPFISVTAGYYKLNNPDENCHGIANLLIDVVFYFLFFVTFILALVGTFGKVDFQKFSIHHAPFIIILLSLSILVYNGAFRGHARGDIWIFSTNKKLNGFYSGQSLTLRKNGNFTIDLNEVDYGCSISGIYVKKGDTIWLAQEAIEKAGLKTNNYLVKGLQLVPLADTPDKITFSIVNIE